MYPSASFNDECFSSAVYICLCFYFKIFETLTFILFPQKGIEHTREKLSLVIAVGRPDFKLKYYRFKLNINFSS